MFACMFVGVLISGPQYKKKKKKTFLRESWLCDHFNKTSTAIKKLIKCGLAKAVSHCPSSGLELKENFGIQIYSTILVPNVPKACAVFQTNRKKPLFILKCGGIA